MSAICDAHKKKVVVELLYNSVHRKFNQLVIKPVGEKLLEWGTYPREADPSGPRLGSLGERERNAVMALRVGGGQYVAVLFSIQLSSHTLKPLVTLSNPFK